MPTKGKLEISVSLRKGDLSMDVQADTNYSFVTEGFKLTPEEYQKVCDALDDAKGIIEHEVGDE